MFVRRKRNVVVVELKNEIEALLENKEKLIKKALMHQSNIEDARKEVVEVKNELVELRLTKKMELKEVEHLVRMAKEKNAIEFEKKLAQVEVEKLKEATELQKTYYDKSMKDLKEISSEILKRLPNVNMSINQGHPKVGK